MKKQLLPFIALLVLACNNTDKKTDPLQAQVDSLEKQVEEGHNIAMPKSMKIPKLQKAVQQKIDSIVALPAKAQEAAAPLKAKLQELVNELNYADNAMNKWMAEMNFDSSLDDLRQRVKYLTGEKLKVDKVREAVLTSIAKADSLLKARF
ncbi:MAG: viral A-type inclusion protein [Chitinophagaceae bacterium]